MFAGMFAGIPPVGQAVPPSGFYFTDQDTDHIYQTDETLGVSYFISVEPGLPADTPVVAELYVLGQTSQKTAILEGSHPESLRIACDTSVANNISFSGIILSGLTAGEIGIQYYIDGSLDASVPGTAFFTGTVAVPIQAGEFSATLAGDQGGDDPSNQNMPPGIQFTKAGAAGDPVSAPFLPDPLHPAPPMDRFSSPDNTFSGFFVQENEYYSTSLDGINYTHKHSLDFVIPSPSTLGADSLALQYYDDLAQGWQPYLHNDQPVVTVSSDQTSFSIYPDSSYQYRVIVNGGNNNGHVSNEVYAELPTQSINPVYTSFAAWTIDESMANTGIMAPHVGYGLLVSGITIRDHTGTTLSSEPTYLSYQWYRVDPQTYAMTLIDDATNPTYATTVADIGYIMLCKISGDDTNVKGYLQLMGQSPVVYNALGYVSQADDTGITLTLKNPVSGLTTADLRLAVNGSSGLEPGPAITGLNQIGTGDTSNAIYRVSADLSLIQDSDPLVIMSNYYWGWQLCGSAEESGGDMPPGDLPGPWSFGGANVSGEINTPNGNEPLENTSVMLISQDGSMMSYFGMVDPTNRNYIIYGVPAGDYLVQIFSPSSLFLSDSTSSVTIPEAETTVDYDLDFLGGTILTGRIVSSDLTPLAGVYITLFDKLPPMIEDPSVMPDPSDFPNVYPAETIHDGTFQVSVPGSGLYYLSTMNVLGYQDILPPLVETAYDNVLGGFQVIIGDQLNPTDGMGSLGDITLDSTAQANGLLNILVTYQDTPISGANVFISNPEQFFFAEGVTAGDGRIPFSNIPETPGYFITASYIDETGRGYFGSQEKVGVKGSTDITIAVRSPEEPPEIGTGEIGGTVSLAGDLLTPLPGVNVFLFCEALQYGTSTATDEEGTYVFTALPNSQQYDYVISTWSQQGLIDPDDPMGMGHPVSIGPVSSAAVKDITLEAPGGLMMATGSSISGKVTENSNGGAVADVVVFASGPMGGGMATTDKAGRYTISGLIAGVYSVDVQGAALSYNDDHRENIQVAENSVTPNIDFSLKPITVDRGKISGIVKSSAGQGLSSVQVNAWSMESMSWGSDVTDARGTFTLENLPAAKDYQLDFGWNSGGQYLYETEANVVVNKDTTTAVTKVMETGLTLAGHFENSSGAGVGEVQITASAQDGSHYAWGTTDVDGNFSMSQMKSNKVYDLTFYINPALGYIIPASVPASVSLAEANKTLADVVLTSAPVLNGKIVNSGGTGISGVDIFGYSSSTQVWSRARSDASGNFTMKGLAPADDYTLSTYDKTGTYDFWEATNVSISGDSNYGNITLLRPSEKLGDFTGNGNYLKVSEQVTSPGKKLTYQLGYKNNGPASVNGVSLTVGLPQGTTMVAGSFAASAAGNLSGGTYTLTDPVAPGSDGTLTYQVTVNADTTLSSIKNSASINVGETATVLGTTTTELAFSTINGPSITKTGKLSVYGDCSAGATVIIEAAKQGETAARRVGRASASGRWWNAEIDLGTTEAVYNITARVELANGSVTKASSPLQTEVKADVVTIESLTVNAGWNRNVKIDPKLGIATMAITENNQISVDVTFSDAVSGTKTFFIDKQANFSNSSGNTWNGDVVNGSWSSSGEELIELEYTYGSKTVRTPVVNVIVLIDPSGFVYDGSYGLYDRNSATIADDTANVRLSGVTALVEVNSKNDGSGTWSVWDASSYGQVNPQTTDANGNYGWDVPAGAYRVVFSKSGYETVLSNTYLNNKVAIGPTLIPPPELKLHVGMVSIAPQVIAKTPAASATNVALDSKITVKFSEAINPPTITDKFTLKKGSTLVGASIFYDSDTNTATMTPSSTLDPSTIYTVSIDSSVKGVDGNNLPATVTWNFTTAAMPASTDLTGLALSGDPTNYTFSGSTYTYNGVAVTNAVDSITVTPSGSGTITVDGAVVASGSASANIALSASVEKTISVVVTESGKSAKTYTIKVTRAAPAPSGGSSSDDTSSGSLPAADTISDSVNKLAATADDKALADTLATSGAAVVDVTGQTDAKAELSAAVVDKLVSEEKPLTVANAGVAVEFGGKSLLTDAVKAAVSDGAAKVEIVAQSIDPSQRDAIIAKTPIGASTGTFSVGSVIVELSAYLVTSTSSSRIEGFSEPVAVTIDLSDIDLTPTMIASLTGARLELNPDGTYRTINLGGKYDPANKTFTFYTDKFSLYTVVQATKMRQLDLSIDNTSVNVNGAPQIIDTAPMIIDDRTMVPLRFIGEALGAEVQWIEQARTVNIKKDGQTLTLVVGQLAPGLDVPATIKNSRTLVPLRYISESFGANVLWFPATRAVRIVL